MPLADEFRPQEIEDVVGQKHLLGKGRIINKILDKKIYPNMIFFGPPGVGKTTVAQLLAKKSDKKFYKINATNSSLEDIKRVISDIGKLGTENGILLYIDEIQSFNKKQQQSLLEYIEVGDITLISSTTENPYHYVYKALLSRSIIFEFKPLTSSDIEMGLKNIIDRYNKVSITNMDIDRQALSYIAEISGGDMRTAINILELSFVNAEIKSDGDMIISKKSVEDSSFSLPYNFDKNGEMHYDLLSAFQKSIRGSDPDASVYYLARLLKGGDLISVCRRLLVTACEDIGLAYPSAISIVKSCVDSAMQVGMPEARIILSQATILLASSPKSNSSYMAINKAYDEIEKRPNLEVCQHLKDSHYSGASKLNRGSSYLYPHDFDKHYVSQQYLPDEIKDEKFYVPQDNKFEKNIDDYFKYLKKNK